MGHFAENTPGFWLLAGVGFAAFIAQVVSLAIAIRQRRRVNAAHETARGSTGGQALAIRLPSTWPCVVLSSTWLFIPAVAAYIVDGTRERLVAAHFAACHLSGELPYRATDQPEVFCFAVAYAVLSAIVAAVALVLTVGSRMKIRRMDQAAGRACLDPSARRQHLFCSGWHSRPIAGLPLALLVLAVFPFAAGLWTYNADLVHPPQLGDGLDRYSPLWARLAHARLLLETWAQLSCVGLVMVAVMAAVFVIASRKVAPGPPAGTFSWPGLALASALCVGISLAVLSAGSPLRAENRTPWPPSADDVVDAWGKHHLSHVPVLAGPDRLARAPGSR